MSSQIERQQSHHDAHADRWPGPLVVRATGAGDRAQLAPESRSSLDRALAAHGAVLFRGFGIDSVASLHDVVSSLSDARMDYVYRSTPRTTVGDLVYTATEYRADATIPMHNENSFQRSWPMKLFFACVQPAASGGDTPLARSVDVTRRIDSDIQRLFTKHGVMYVRNYGHGVDLPWQTVFQTDSREEVDAFCARNSIECKWLSDDHLRTRQVCQAMARHPHTGELLWFNQAHLFHVSSLDPSERQVLLELFAEQDLPRNAYLGDGTRLDDDILEHIRQAYVTESVASPWQQGDLLIVDNMQVAHGRRPFSGARKILVAMSDPYGSTPVV